MKILKTSNPELELSDDDDDDGGMREQNEPWIGKGTAALAAFSSLSRVPTPRRRRRDVVGDEVPNVGATAVGL